MNSGPLVKVKDLYKYFPVTSGIFHREERFVRAVDGVSFEINRSQNLALVGESGCGKTTLARVVLRLIPPTSGSVFFEGRDIFRLPEEDMRRLRSKMQIVFQDPYASLNPRKNIRQILSKPLELHTSLNKNEIDEKIHRVLEIVGLVPADLYADRNPHEFSGGQRQRICIARAIVLDPTFIVADEPVSALDVSIRAQILNLLKDLTARLSVTYLFITHDLAVVRFVSDQVAVMYLGRIVEMSDVSALFESPLHPYTEILLSATPIPNPGRSRSRVRFVLHGDVPSSLNPPKGCRFHTRCPFVMDRCRHVEPVPTEHDHRWVACHLRA